jgi:hypothetical protein
MACNRLGTSFAVIEPEAILACAPQGNETDKFFHSATLCRMRKRVDLPFSRAPSDIIIRHCK